VIAPVAASDVRAPADPIDVVLVEDHPTFRLGLRTRLEHEPDLTVTGEAGTGAEALAVVTEVLPDVVVVDLKLPDMFGVDLIKRIVDATPTVAILVLTMLDDNTVFAAMRAGARGYLLKDAEPGRIVAAVRSVAAGEAMFSPSVAHRLLGLVAERVRSGAVPTFAGLSAREHEILELVAGGIGNVEISRRLGLRPKTVRNYVSNILTKLQVADRAEAIARARDAGMG